MNETPAKNDQQAATPPAFEDDWHLQTPSEKDDGSGRMTLQVGINVIAAWDKAKTKGIKLDETKESIKVVIFDTGVDLDHPSLDRKESRELARDFDHSLSGDGKSLAGGGRIANPLDAHGTACAGLVGAKELPRKVTAVVGVAPECTLVPVRISTNFETSALIKALYYARDNGHVILLPRVLVETPALTAVLESIGATKPIVCAAGNDGWDSLIYPASLPFTIGVGACNNRGFRSTYSQYGEGLDVVAPSNDIPAETKTLKRLDRETAIARLLERAEEDALRHGKPIPSLWELTRRLRKPKHEAAPENKGEAALGNKDAAAPEKDEPFPELSDADIKSALDRLAAEKPALAMSALKTDDSNLDHMGEAAIATTDNLGASGYNFDPAGNYCKANGRFGFGGTSAAAAQVAGVVALMLAAKPALIGHPDVVLDILRSSANKKCFPGGYNQVEHGHGLINAELAVTKALEYGNAGAMAAAPEHGKVPQA